MQKEVSIIYDGVNVKTMWALVDIRESKLILRVGEDAITFGVD